MVLGSFGKVHPCSILQTMAVTESLLQNVNKNVSVSSQADYFFNGQVFDETWLLVMTGEIQVFLK